jgi:hypothetical protein
MNCKQVEELLPLYVGHDLEDERARLITSHVHTCTPCTSSVEEYIEAGQLLQQFAVPQFSEAAYATVRQNVLREIEQESGRLTLRELVLSAFQPRLTWAVSTAVLLAVCAFAYYFVTNRANLPQDHKANTDIKLAPDGAADGRGPRQGSLAGVVDSPAVATSSPNHRLNLMSLHKTVRPNLEGGLHSLAKATNSRKPRLSQPSWHSQSAGEPPAVPGAVPTSVPATFDTSISSRKPMRLEIQTSDPNIRIIWFSQPSTQGGSPNESSKGI